MKYFLFVAVLPLLLGACTKDRDVTHAATPVGLKINEYVASGSTQLNEFGIASDWFELYNAGADTLNLDAGEWFVTNNLSLRGHYPMPARTIAPHGFMIVWCDKDDTVANAVHSNFNLSASGETIGLFMLSGQDTLMLDSRTFGQQVSAKSEGRYPDGTDNWMVFNTPTPGASNHP